MLAYRRDSRTGDHVRGLERFYVPYFDREMRKEDVAFMSTVRDWITKLSKEKPEELRLKSDQEPTESEFFTNPPTHSHARMLFRTVLQNGFARRARRTGKMYKDRDLMPDSAAIRNFFEWRVLESPEEVYRRLGSFRYFSAIVTFYAQENLSWLLLNRVDTNAPGVWAKKNFLENWKGKGIDIRLVEYNERYWSLFLTFCIIGINNPETLSDLKVFERILNAVTSIPRMKGRS